MAAIPKTIIIGLDGGTFTILKPLMDQGLLPTLKQIADQGVSGEFARFCPDFTYLPGSDCHGATLMGFCSNKTVMRNFIQPGHHTRQGILLAQGPAFAEGKKIDGARFMDIGPTALHLLGEKVPAGLDGRVLTELFTDEFAASRPVAYQDVREPDKQAAGFTDSDKQDVVEKLKGLGYM